tara:strand:- start:853 stop:1068 length:216 start_codon:yes stop_codon:yes gene_type:complete
MSIGFWQIAIVVVLVVLLFGRGKISSLMGDVAKGIKSFKKGMKDPTDPTSDQSESISTKETSSEDSNSEKN